MYVLYIIYIIILYILYTNSYKNYNYKSILKFFYNITSISNFISFKLFLQTKNNIYISIWNKSTRQISIRIQLSVINY